ncbi:MAG: L,D-transpeptidase family protein [Pseudomonadales bacterium]|jgi:murein L,D-transpeptidase YafK|nr:L,D-transpeptidase family protein [Pseudomonadales bacterium]
MKRFLTFMFIIAVAGAHADEIDHVLVKKSERQLLLMSGSIVVKSYPISLGEQPVGHKQREGDERTPEGQYVLDWRNPESRFYKSIRISYPNDQDQMRAEKNNHSPGGDIFIHGLPNGVNRLARTFRGRNWTDGCIAVNNNDHMDEIWQLVKDGTRITIRP